MGHAQHTPQPRLLDAAARGAAAGTAVQAAYLVTRFLLTPLVIARAGVEAYGFWSMLFASLGVLGLQRTGVLSASVALVARHLADGDSRRAVAVIRTVASVCAALGAVVSTVASVGAERIVDYVGVDGALRSDAVGAVRWTVVATAAALTWGGYQSFLEARQRHATVRSIEGLSQVVEAVLVVALLLSGGGLLSLAIAYAVRVLGPAVGCAWVVHRTEAVRGLGPGGFDAAELRSIVRLGGQVQLIGILHMAIAALPRLVIARALGLGPLGVFEAARKLVEFSTNLPAFSLGPLIAGSAAVGGRRDSSVVRRRIAVTATRFVAVFGALPLAILWTGRDALGVLWLGEQLSGFGPVIAALVPAAWLHLCTGPFTAVLRGSARPGAELLYCLLWLALLAVAMPLVAPVGLGAAAIAVAGVQASVCVVLLALAARQLTIGRGALALDLARAAVVLLVAVAIATAVIDASATERIEALQSALFTACLVVLVGATAGWRYVLEDDDREVSARGVRAVAGRFGFSAPAPPVRRESLREEQ